MMDGGLYIMMDGGLYDGGGIVHYTMMDISTLAPLHAKKGRLGGDYILYDGWWIIYGWGIIYYMMCNAASFASSDVAYPDHFAATRA